MMISSIMKLLLLIALATMSQAEEVRHRQTVNAKRNSPSAADLYALGKTGWGNWGSTKSCRTGKYVRGFRLKVEGKQGLLGDDTALNGVSFKCNDNRVLKSAVGWFGSWTSWKYCPEGHFANGINFRSEKDQGDLRDDSAGNNLNVRCTDGSWLFGDGGTWGEWDAFYCQAGYKICGLQTKVEGLMGPIVDDTSLNMISVTCC